MSPPMPVLEEVQNRNPQVAISAKDQERAKAHIKDDEKDKDNKDEDTSKTKSKPKSKASVTPKSKASVTPKTSAKKAAKTSAKKKAGPKSKQEEVKISERDLAEAGGSAAASSSGINSFFPKVSKAAALEQGEKEAEKEREKKLQKEEQRKELDREEKELKELKEKLAKKERDVKRKRDSLGAKQEVKEEADDDMDLDDFKAEGGSSSKPSKKRSAEHSEAPASKKKKSVPKSEVCKHCTQDLDVAGQHFYGGHPEGSVEESIALCDPSIMDEDAVMDDDEKPQHRITDFVFFDEEGHIVRFDLGIIENGGQLFISGYMKPVYDDSPVKQGGVAVCKAGPILEWWVTGLDGGERHVMGITTEMGWYYLLAPAEDYTKQMRAIDSKVYIGKCVIELLNTQTGMDDLEYEDLLHHLEGKMPPPGIEPINEDNVILFADMIVGMVVSFEEAADEDEEVFMMDSPAMKNLMALAGLNKAKAKKVRSIRRGPNEAAPAGKNAKMKMAQFTKATTTRLVKMVMESFFQDRIAGVSEDKKGKKKSKKTDAGSDEEEAEEEAPAVGKNDSEERKPEVMSAAAKKRVLSLKRDARPSVHWDGDALEEGAERSYYPAVVVDGERYEVGDYAFVHIEDKTSHHQLHLRRIEYLFEDSDGEFMAHVQWFVKGCNTVLGSVAEEKEVFQMGYCDDALASDFVDKVTVTFWATPKNWHEMGGTDEAALMPPPINPEDDNEYFYRMRYDEDFARFEHGFKMSKKDKRPRVDSCLACPYRADKVKRSVVQAAGLLSEDCDEKGRYQWSTLESYGHTLKAGDACYLMPPPGPVKKSDEERGDDIDQRKRTVDQNKYPEFYRKSRYVRGSNEKTSKPFSVAIVEAIYSADMEGKKRLKMSVRKLYRPEDTNLSDGEIFAKDLNLVYWSEDVISVDALNVKGKCYVRPEVNINDTVKAWTKAGENRFYYNMMYNKISKEMEELTPKAERYGATKQKGKGKSTTGSAQTSSSSEESDTGALPVVARRKLRALDVFAGCGGLSCGLHDSGAVESKWAIEVFEPAALAYKANNPDCTVFTDCCNLLLEKVMNGEDTNEKMQKLPKKGEVDLLCGGPPCQGFSGMNRFNEGDYSSFKNSLIATYLSYADYYRPKYFILENVRNFASYKKSAVLKLCLQGLLKMGYACTFGILQAGSYGVPQTRRRAILLAAAPGEKLPFYPEPTNVFAKTCLTVQIDGTQYGSNARWTESASRRTITVRDVMSDLPPINSSPAIEVQSYVDEPRSHFQRLMRERSQDLHDHMCKQMSAIVDARMSLIPTDPGCDWRDLPNTIVKLRDGTYSDKLVYTHNDYREGRGKNGALRGVCDCAVKKGAQCPEGNSHKQSNTLIPWCLPHTSARHNQWAGLYGRLENSGYFSTTVTNPEPMGKQGRVLHPEQHRLVSIRECARSQGFPDWYRFHGTILEKHRQIGNAVPPPMGLAIGNEIRKAMMQAPNAKEEIQKKEEEENSK